MNGKSNPRHAAYCAFMRRHRETVWRVCWHFARQGRGGRNDRLARAKDMAQEVWIVLWLKFDQLKPEYTESQQRRWLGRLTRSVLIDLYHHPQRNLNKETLQRIDGEKR